MELGSWMSVVKMNVRSVMPVVAWASVSGSHRFAPVFTRTREWPIIDQHEVDQGDSTADRRDGRQVEGDDQDHDRDRAQEEAHGAGDGPPAMMAGNWPVEASSSGGLAG